MGDLKRVLGKFFSFGFDFFVGELRFLFLLIVRLEDRIDKVVFSAFLFLEKEMLAKKRGAGAAAKLTLVGTGTDGKAV